MKRGRAAEIRLSRVISGGQVGADRVALEVAQNLRIPTGGYAPRSFMTSKGPDRTLKTRFGLKEITTRGSTIASYVRRTKKNVDDADGTLVVRTYASRGTDKTIRYCQCGKWTERADAGEEPPHRPHLVIRTLESEDRTASAAKIVEFVVEHGITTLNVAGHRAVPGIPDYEWRLRQLFELAFSRMRTNLDE